MKAIIKHHINFLSFRVFLANVKKSTFAAAMMISPKIASMIMVVLIPLLSASLDERKFSILLMMENSLSFWPSSHSTYRLRLSLSSRLGR